MVRLGNAGPRRGQITSALSSAGLRFERSRIGEVLISGLVIVVVLIGVVWNLPDSRIKRTSIPTLHPIAASVGLQQSWQMYAPEPISALETLEVRVTMADGSNRLWTWHRGDRLVGPFSWYRWQKLKEQAIRDPNSRAGIARWAVRKLTVPAENPVRVQMMFRNELLPAPGADGPRDVFEETLYDEVLTRRP
jgi:hypothetical protein